MLIALCDSSILGKKFFEKEKQLDLSGSFYQGEKVEEEKLSSLIKKAYIINAVGKESVAFCLKNKLVKKENILFVSGVPHCQIVFADCE